MATNLSQFIREKEASRQPGDTSTHVYNVRMRGMKGENDKRKPGSILIWAAALLLLALAAAQGYVSWRAQFRFADAVRHDVTASRLEAAGLDCAAVIFALLGLAHARMGRSAKIERTLNVACAAGSMTMNVLAASLGSPRSVAVYILPPLLYIAGSDRLIAVVGSQAGVPQPSVWQGLGRAAPYVVRLILAPPSTVMGLRRWLLDVTPLPGPAGKERPEIQSQTPAQAVLAPRSGRPAQARRPRRRIGESKKAVLLRLYADHPDHGDRTKVTAVASELAPQAGYSGAGSARTVLYQYVDSLNGEATP